jgi:hypothetical protein
MGGPGARRLPVDYLPAGISGVGAALHPVCRLPELEISVEKPVDILLITGG